MKHCYMDPLLVICGETISVMNNTSLLKHLNQFHVKEGSKFVFGSI